MSECLGILRIMDTYRSSSAPEHATATSSERFDALWPCYRACSYAQ